MSKNIFDIVGVNAAIKVGDKQYELKDPNTKSKMIWMKAIDEFGQKKAEMSVSEAAEKDWELQKDYVKLYLPDMTNDEMDNMGQAQFRTLSDTITAMAEDNFGAHVRKLELEKKS